MWLASLKVIECKIHEVHARHVPFSRAAFIWRNACLQTRVRTSGIVHSSACVHICTFSSAAVGVLLERNRCIKSGV